VKKLTKMYWYNYNNTVPLLNIAKTWIFYLVYNFKIFLKFSTISSADQPANQPDSLPAVRPSSASVWLQIFHTRKVITSSLRICYSEEGSFTAPWFFFYPLLLSFLFYSPVKKWETRERGADQLLIMSHENSCLHNYETGMMFPVCASLHDYTHEQIDFECFSIVTQLLCH